MGKQNYVQFEKLMKLKIKEYWEKKQKGSEQRDPRIHPELFIVAQEWESNYKDTNTEEVKQYIEKYVVKKEGPQEVQQKMLIKIAKKRIRKQKKTLETSRKIMKVLKC